MLFRSELTLVTDRLKMAQGELANARQQARQIRTEYSQKLEMVQNEIAAKASADEAKKHEDFVTRMVAKGYTPKQVRLLCEWYLRVRKSS